MNHMVRAPAGIKQCVFISLHLISGLVELWVAITAAGTVHYPLTVAELN